MLHDIAYTMHLDKWSADIAVGMFVARSGPDLMGLLMALAVLALGGWAYRNARNYKWLT